jgi:hypothetical protein
MNAITPEQHEQLKLRIEPLRQQVEEWRKHKGSNEKMPGPLWEAAIGLAKVYGVSPVQRILRVDYRGLERRAFGIIKGPAGTKAPARPHFLELPSMPGRRVEHLVEWEDGMGRKLSLKIAAGHLAEVLPLVQAFWRPGL